MTEESPITSFEILGLHGDRNIRLDFEDPVTILVGENGSGKTTVLNTLHNLLSANLGQLRRLQFQEIRLTFPKDETVIVRHEDIHPEGELQRHSMITAAVRGNITPSEFNQLRSYARRYPHMDLRSHPFVRELLDRTGIPWRVLEEFLLRSKSSFIDSDRGRHPETDNLRKELGRLQDLFPYQILFLPTYRRIEEDLHNLGYDERELDRGEQLIHFGMRDVKGRFDRVTEQIRDSTLEWFSIISGQMLDQLAGSIRITDESRSSIENRETLKIVLDRIGENISDASKQRILELVDSGNIKDLQYDPLVLFLSNLIEVYDEQRDRDSAIKSFASVTRQYLTDKEVVYDESRVNITIIHKRTGKEVPLSGLSSGEKQVISIFSRLYLDKAEPCAVIFDEPELSLSLEWQRILLPHIVESGQCIFLLAATHSPFIFENELDRFASPLPVQYLEGVG